MRFSKTTALILLLLFLLPAFTSLVHAETKLEVGIPGTPGVAAGGSVAGPAQYIKYIYLFVLGFVGIAGFVTLVIWGTVWTASGIIDQKARAMEGIKNSLIGIGIAFTAFILLNTVNPDLTIIKAPTVSSIKSNANASSQTFAGSIIPTVTAPGVTGKVAACCYLASGPAYQWACMGQNELDQGTGCSSQLGLGWQTFTTAVTGCAEKTGQSAPAC
ncbi:hypothetical protein HY250_02920 [Candidatus Azambacteria bacterium]|nr:hypothetical protein [Candidatus Azambacteria bacterium]MBI3685331.1 hypothetical protein [Candidatus Azambacteria bacterium]